MKSACPRTAFFFVIATLVSLSVAAPRAEGQKPRRDLPVSPTDLSLRPNTVAQRQLVAKDHNPPLEKDTVNPSPAPNCWKRKVTSVSYHSGDCMPYHWFSFTKRTHTHHIASNEVVTGKCGIVASDKVRNDDDLGWIIDYDENARKVSVELRNHGGEFCFGDKDFGAACIVDRKIC